MFEGNSSQAWHRLRIPLHRTKIKGREDCAAIAIMLANGGDIEVKAPQNPINGDRSARSSA
jgi:hypothetical protein